MREIYLICGVPGSGKTWVASRLREKFDWIAHDEYLKLNYARALVLASKKPGHPIIAEAPFAERALRDELHSHGCKVNPVFIIEPPHIVKSRYEAREGKPISQANMTRAVSIKDRAKEWSAPIGTSTEILKYLQEIK